MMKKIDGWFFLMNMLLTIYFVELVFPPITLIVNPTLVCLACLVMWLALSFIRDMDFYTDIKRNLCILYPLVFYAASIIIPYISGNTTIGNRDASLALLPIGYIIFNYYDKHRRLHELKNILCVVGAFATVTFIKTFAALIKDPNVSRTIKTSGEHTEALYRQGIGGYSFVYFIAICAVIVLFIAIKEKRIVRKILFSGLYIVSALFVVKSSYVTAFLLVLLCSAVLLVFEFTTRKNLWIVFLVCVIGIMFLVYHKAIIDAFSYLIPPRIADVLVVSESESVLESIFNEFMYDRFPVMKYSVDAYLRNPIGGMVLNGKIGVSNGYLVGFSQHSHILDMFALFGTTMGILNVLILFRPFKNRCGRFVKENKSLTIAIITAMLTVLIFNNATESIGLAITIIYPLVREYYKKRPRRIEDR